VLGARVAGIDRPVGRAGMPFVDGRVELNAGIGTRPGGISDLVPELASLEALARFGRAILSTGFFLFRSPIQMPRTVAPYRLHELVRNANGVVAVLSRDSVIGLRVLIGVVLLKLNAH